MKRSLAYGMGVVAATATLSTAFAGAADATPNGTVYFSAQGFNCSITGDGTVGCDLTSPARFSFLFGQTYVPLPFPVREVLIDVPWAPAHPGLGIGTPHTRPGGNPDISTFGTTTGSGATRGPAVFHAGAVCSVGFHGSFGCTSKGHHFDFYETLTGS